MNTLSIISLCLLVFMHGTIIGIGYMCHVLLKSATGGEYSFAGVVEMTVDVLTGRFR